jgi:lysozyme family protein
MPTVSFTPALREEYDKLFNTCAVRAERAASLEAMIQKLRANARRYKSAGDATGIPWYFVAVIHNMESSLNFTRHLHNGDPLTARTVQVPAGRPKSGNPPFTWEQSAADALGMKQLGADTDWSLAGTLYQIERYNGWGYRLYHPHVWSPYLWSFSNHYKGGKYVADGTWSDTAASQQCGAAVLLRRMVERGEIEFPDQPISDLADKPLVVRHAQRKSQKTDNVASAENLQRWLNTFPGIFLKVDGIPGDRTSDGYKKVTGFYLPGDPRGRKTR